MAKPILRKKGEKPRINAWSPSRLYDYEACPRKAKYKIIDRLPDPGSPAMTRGTDLHQAAEDYVAGRAKKIHEELRKVASHLRQLAKEYKNKHVFVEMQAAFNRQWEPCGYFDQEAWLRLKIDVVHDQPKKQHVHVIDWKTGRFKPDDASYGDQLHLYALAALIVRTGLAKTSSAALIFTDHGEVVRRPEAELTLDLLPAAQKKWEARVWAMLEDTTFEPHPGNACRFCPFSRNRGGPCEF